MVVYPIFIPHVDAPLAIASHSSNSRRVIAASQKADHEARDVSRWVRLMTGGYLRKSMTSECVMD